MNNDDDNNKRQKFDEEVDYKKLEDLLCSYRELKFKYKSLEETNVDLEEKLWSLAVNFSGGGGENKKIGGIKSALNLCLIYVNNRI